MGLMKVFSGSEILALAFGNLGQAVEVFIQETDFAKANPVIEEFRMSI